MLDCVNLVLTRARETEFYREWLDGCPAQIETLAQLRAFPVTRKEDVLRDLAEHPPYGRRLRVPVSEIRHLVETSGTSGTGQEVYPLDAEDEQAVWEMAARGFAWAGVNAGSVVLNTLPLTTSAAGQWYYHGLRLLGANVLEVGSFSTERKLSYLQRFEPDTIIGTPSYVFRLAVEARRAGLDPSAGSVRRMVVAGESWSVAWMQQLESEWGARVFEQYGCTQRGMAWTCPAGGVDGDARGTLHALSDHGVYEVLEPETGEPVSEGRGHLVITPFASSASPLVRFATGDCVTVVSDCGCGRPGPCLQAGTVERYDFMVKIRGVNVWPEALDAALFAIDGVREYEAVVEIDDRGREHLQVHIELGGEVNDATGRAGAAIKQVTGLSADIAIVPEAAISRAVEDRFKKRRRLHDRRSNQVRG
jgi:phenylacetate-CoA ligase